MEWSICPFDIRKSQATEAATYANFVSLLKTMAIVLQLYILQLLLCVVLLFGPLLSLSMTVIGHQAEE